MASMMGMLQQPGFQEQMAQKVEELKKDPEMADVMKEFEEQVCFYICSFAYLVLWTIE